MNKATRKELVRLVRLRCGPITRIVAPAIDSARVVGDTVERLDPELVHGALYKAGYIIVCEPKTNGAWVKVFQPYSDEERSQCKPEATDEDCRYLRAQGYDATPAEALLQAVFGAAREEEAAKAVDDALTERDIRVDAALRAKLESRYILEGGAARLKADLDAFPTAPAAT